MNLHHHRHWGAGMYEFVNGAVPVTVPLVGYKMLQDFWV